MKLSELIKNLTEHIKESGDGVVVVNDRDGKLDLLGGIGILEKKAFDGNYFLHFLSINEFNELTDNKEYSQN